jgi:hypothetical protein
MHAGFHGQLGNGHYELCMAPAKCRGKGGGPYLVRSPPKVPRTMRGLCPAGSY